MKERTCTALGGSEAANEEMEAKICGINLVIIGAEFKTSKPFSSSTPSRAWIKRPVTTAKLEKNITNQLLSRKL